LINYCVAKILGFNKFLPPISAAAPVPRDIVKTAQADEQSVQDAAKDDEFTCLGNDLR
jgi:hypothetical protein